MTDVAHLKKDIETLLKLSTACFCKLFTAHFANVTASFLHSQQLRSDFLCSLFLTVMQLHYSGSWRVATEATQVGRAEDVDQEQAEGHRWGVEKY